MTCFKRQRPFLLGLVVFVVSLHKFDAFVSVHNTVETRPRDSTNSRSSSSRSSLLASPSSSSSNAEHNREQPRSWRKAREYKNNFHKHRPLRRKATLANTPYKNEDRAWLLQTTQRLLSAPEGSLVKGKWHQIPSAIRGWSRLRKDDQDVPNMMEKLIRRLAEERMAGNLDVRITVEQYNLLIDAWACVALFHTHHKPKAASRRTREILVNLQQSFEELGDPLLEPTNESFHTTFHVVFKYEGLEVARKVLAWMEYLYKNQRNRHSRPRRKHYMMLLEAYSACGSNAGVLTDGFLRHMKTMGEPLDTYCYNLALKGWAQSKRGREAAEHADRILDEMDQPKDLVTYSTAMKAWGSSGMRSHAMARVEDLLQEILHSSALEPNTIVLNTVMSTCVKSRDPESTNKTKRLLELMMDSDTNLEPDLISFNTHLHALSMHANRPGNAQKADELLNLMETNHQSGVTSFKPNRFSYNLVIDAWSRTEEEDAAWNAVRVLRRLLDDAHDSPHPDTFSFNQVLSALSRSSREGAARLAEQLLDYMIDAHRMQLYKSARPDVLSYTFAIVTLTRSGEENSAARAERLLYDMKEACERGEEYLKPTRYIYNTIIGCWAKSGRGTYGARRAEALFQEMEDMYASGDASVSPNIITWNAVVNSWARSGTRCGANKAEKYMERMWDLYNSGDENIAPNEKTFNTVINAISKGPYHDKAQKALRVLRRMDKLYQAGYKEAKPDEITYTSVLKSCAFPASLDSKTRRKAYYTAMFTWQELKESRYAHPNDVTYGTFIRACSNLLTEDDTTLRHVLQDAFQHCKEAGQVGEQVLCNLRKAAPEDLYQDLLSEASLSSEVIKVDDLPFTWRRNLSYK